WGNFARAAVGDEPGKVFAEIAEIAVVDVVMPTRKGVAIRKRCVAKPIATSRFTGESRFVVKTFGGRCCKQWYLSPQLRKLG
ncbi:MAG: hypothetical protein ACK58M_15580, partial [Acidobacteriota bacterium]|nr:hypothetical protein [Bryobacteraceae bacterium CoA2 C42]